MKKISKKIIILLAVGMIAAFTVGCSKKDKLVETTNFKLIVESEKGFDNVKFEVGDLEFGLEPMHDDKEVKAGYSFNSIFDQVDGLPLSVEVFKNGEVVLSEEGTLDLSDRKDALVKIVDNKDGGLKLEIKN